MFKFNICEDEGLFDLDVSFNRIAVRGVIIKGDNILMVRSNKGDYKFPGGGLKFNETHEEALIREVREETGYKVSKVLELIGEVTEVFKDKFESDKAFVMNSYYYKCKVYNNVFDQCLDSYEKELGFIAEWVNIKDAIFNNKGIIDRKNPDNIDWIVRETYALENIYNIIYK